MTSNFLKSINLQKLIQVNLLILVNYANQSEDRKVQNSTTPVLVAVICGELEQSDDDAAHKLCSQNS